MPKKPTGRPNGRPRIEIDENQFNKLCELQCTEEEIAGFFECSVDTLNNWCKRTFGCTFSEKYRQKATRGKIALRRLQLQHAQKSPSMAIFLGKQWLGQRDREVQDVLRSGQTKFQRHIHASEKEQVEQSAK